MNVENMLTDMSGLVVSKFRNRLVSCVRLSKFRRILIDVRFPTPQSFAQPCYFPECLISSASGLQEVLASKTLAFTDHRVSE